MRTLKRFFGIETNYKFEMMDLFSIVTILNVTFILMGFGWAPALGVLNCILNIFFALDKKTHLNFYTMQIALIILNIYFLILQLTSKKIFDIIIIEREEK